MGLKTCGIGHLCVGAQADAAVGTPVSQEQVQAYFDSDIQRSIALAMNYVPQLAALDDVRWVVVVSLAFNLGNRLGEFHQTLAALNSGDYVRAATQLQDSAWYGEVGRRGPELCAALNSGIFGFPTD